MKLTGQNIRALAICFFGTATAGVGIYQNTQKLTQAEHDPAAYIAATNQSCLEKAARYNVHHGALDDKSLTENFQLSSTLTPENIQTCKQESGTVMKELRHDRLWLGALGGASILMGVAYCFGERRRHDTSNGPKP